MIVEIALGIVLAAIVLWLILWLFPLIVTVGAIAIVLALVVLIIGAAIHWIGLEPAAGAAVIGIVIAAAAVIRYAWSEDTSYPDVVKEMPDSPSRQLMRRANRVNALVAAIQRSPDWQTDQIRELIALAGGTFRWVGLWSARSQVSIFGLSMDFSTVAELRCWTLTELVAKLEAEKGAHAAPPKMPTMI